MAKRGRRTDCTPEIIKMISDNIKLGLSNRDAVAIAGISRASFYNWYSWGEKELVRITEGRDRKVRKEKQPYVDFYEAIEKAKPLRKQSLIGQIQIAARGSGQVTETRRVFKHNDQGQNILEEEIVTIRPIYPAWQAAAWLLERLHPDEFGRRQTVEIKDWREALPEDANPEEIERQFMELMAMAAAQAEDDDSTS